MTYYTIYKDVFNIILLGIFFDDQQAIFEDGISGKYFLSVKFLCFFVTLAFYIWLYKRAVDSTLFKIRIQGFLSAILNLVYFLLFALRVTFLFNSAFSLKEVSLDQEVKPVKIYFYKKSLLLHLEVFMGYMKDTRQVKNQLLNLLSQKHLMQVQLIFLVYPPILHKC